VLDRRDFLKASIVAAAAFRSAQAMPGDKFRWACTSGMFRNLEGQPDSTLKMISDYGFQGVEATLLLEQSCGSAKELKNRMDKYDIACANYWGGGDYYNPKNPEAVRATVADNIALARDHVAVCGGRVLKVNLTWRDLAAHPIPNWWTTEEMSVLAKTLNEIGKGCHDAGVRFTFHPHNWTLIDTDYAEVKRIMDLTDPRYVFMVADTAHLSLGGTDPIRFVNDWFPRIGDVHLKDVIVKYSPAKSGWKGPAPSKEEHARDNLYKQLGTGGVDFAGFIGALRSHGYDGWVSLDFDPLRPGEGTIQDNMAFRRKYLIENLHASLGDMKDSNQ
jgi:sugar phosphate isomerase/epimerase